jgi:hypothetical protein
MDLFIEACGRWESFHPQLIGEIHRALAAAVPERYFVDVEVRSYVAIAGTEGKEFPPFLPDIGITAPPDESSAKRASMAIAEATETEAVSMQAFVATEFRETFIEILESDPEERLVTCIEVLSPSNKQRGSKGWKRYLRKRNALLLGSANLVELDLLRGGTRLPMMTPWPDSPYTLLVSREQHAPHCKVWPAHFQKPLPVIPVPLSPPDADILLDLQSALAAVYARSHYDRRLDYSRPLKPELTSDESTWLAERLRARS